MMAAETNAKRWWERPVGIVALGVVVTVVGGFLLWLMLRPFDKPTPSAAIGAPKAQQRPEPPQPDVKPQESSQPQSPRKHGDKKDGGKIEQHGTGSGAVGGSVQQGPCSSLQIGGSGNQSTVNCGPPPPPPLHYTWSVKDVKSEKREFAFAKEITVQTNIIVQPVFIGVIADEEIKDLSVCCGIFMMESVGRDTNDKRKWFVSFDNPAFRPEKPLIVTVLSDKPLSILVVTPNQGR
jgi:hypothetical protein